MKIAMLLKPKEYGEILKYRRFAERLGAYSFR